MEVDGDLLELKALAKLLDGKKVPEILQWQQSLAKENGITWASNAPPSFRRNEYLPKHFASEKRS